MLFILTSSSSSITYPIYKF